MAETTTTETKTETTTPPVPADKGTAKADAPKVLTVELNPDGSFKEIPKEVKDLVTREVAKVIGKVREDANNPAAIEKLKALEAENERFKVEEAERLKNYDEANRLREERYTKREKELLADIERRTQRLADMALNEVRACALRHGAREDAIDDIADLLAKRVAVDEKTLDTVVLGDDRKPLDGGSVEALVKDFLDAKPMFKKPPQGGGGARGGYSATAPRGGAASQAQAEYDAAMADWQKTGSTAAMMRVRSAKAALAAASAA